MQGAGYALVSNVKRVRFLQLCMNHPGNQVKEMVHDGRCPDYDAVRGRKID